MRRNKRHRKNKLIILLIILIVIIIGSVVIIKSFTATNKAEPLPEKQDTTSQQEYDYSSPVPKSPAVENTYFDDAIFIGNSRTEGFFLYSGLSNSKVYAHKGLMVNTFFTDKIYTQNEKKVTMLDAIKSDSSFNKAYIMLGMNELGWGYPDLFIEKYSKIIDEVRNVNPNAIIYIQSIIPVSKDRSLNDKIYNMDNINKFNKLIKQMAQNKKVYYINLSEKLSNDEGFLPPDVSYDGIHLKSDYCKKWLKYLKTHTVKEA
ncbi:MAG: GDSL-type esterase/lipase family protein [Eubacteriales bacterium]|nr:GDSL-type esterase/lipase family protein [Eubacteriales bacterium]